MFNIRKAERTQTKLRIGLSAPSGAGKTYSALLMASGIASSWDKILLIDTESGRGDFYSDLGEYNIITLKAPFSPERYVEAIQAAESAGMEVIIVDSISHEWEGKGGVLELVESVAQSKFRGNSYAAWSELTPRHQRFVEAIITSSCHIITTVRNKVDTIMTDDKKVKKVGIKEITREGYEYEVTVNFNIDRDTHKVTASKDNTRLFDSRDPFIITQETGKELIDWVKSGKKVTKPVEAETVEITKEDVVAFLTGLGIERKDMAAYILEKTKLDAKTAEPKKVLAALKKVK